MWCYEFSSAFGATGGQAEQTHQTPLPLADSALPGAWLPPFLGRVVSQYSWLPALCCKHSKGFLKSINSTGTLPMRKLLTILRRYQ